MSVTAELPPYTLVADDLKNEKEAAKKKAITRLLLSETQAQNMTEPEHFMRHLQSFIDVGVTQIELAEWAGTSQANLSRWLRGQSCPTKYSRLGVLNSVNRFAEEYAIAA